MNNKEIVFIVYVNDIKKSVEFYTHLLGLKTTFESPRYVTMDLAQGVALALWSGKKEEIQKSSIRTTEVCLNLSGGEKDILETYRSWLDSGVVIAEEPYQDVFGTTFVALDPDKNRIRVAPVD